MRFQWTGELNPELHLFGGALFLGGLSVFSWALAANPYFESGSRIQEDRGQIVWSSGPYRFVRHPGYLGAIGQSVGVPLLLGSLWALIPGFVASLLIVLRTRFEDRMLHRELDGYPEYAQEVRFRLLPGLW